MSQATSDATKSAVKATELQPDASFGVIKNLRILKGIAGSRSSQSYASTPSFGAKFKNTQEPGYKSYRNRIYDYNANSSDYKVHDQLYSNEARFTILSLISFVGILVAGCVAWHLICLCKPGRALIHINALDSEEEDHSTSFSNGDVVAVYTNI